MRGSKTLDELTKKVREDAAKPPTETDEDSWEEPSGDGRSSRQQVLGVQLIDEKKRLWWIPYGAILWAEGTYNGGSFRFEVARGDTLYEAIIEGPEATLQPVVDRLMEGKRISIRWNGVTISAITVRAVPKRG